MAYGSVCLYATRNNNEANDDHEDDEIILDIGDVTFFVPRSILTAVDHFFDHIRSVGKPLPTDADIVTVDRDAAMFHVILRYLRAVRDGYATEFLDTLTDLPVRQRAKVVREADFYGLLCLRDYVLYIRRIPVPVVDFENRDDEGEADETDGAEEDDDDLPLDCDIRV
jgi:hypothetical protein